MNNLIQKNKLVFFIFILTYIKFAAAIPFYFCTAANTNFFPRLLNLIGSIHNTQFKETQEIAVFNLGLKSNEIEQLRRMQKVKVYEVELVHPQLLKNDYSINNLRCFAWKPVVIKQALDIFPYVIWLDAGNAVLKPLTDLFEYLISKGYFLSTIGDEKTADNKNFQHNVEWGMTNFVRHKFNMNDPVNKWILPKESVMGNVIGVTRASKELFLMPLYELSKDLKNYQDDGTATGGHNCGRHDQVLLSIIAYSTHLDIFEMDYTEQLDNHLVVNGIKKPFFMTWNRDYLSDKTCIWNCRGDLRNFKNYIIYN